jgi:hypothetical protein
MLVLTATPWLRFHASPPAFTLVFVCIVLVPSGVFAAFTRIKRSTTGNGVEKESQQLRNSICP